ncbi:MAG TPA: helix-turn-helix domain-containing protein [Clostridia bacterium]|nr:helix-turn-helix domain-containing protein [Clostridia bacterium]
MAAKTGLCAAEYEALLRTAGGADLFRSLIEAFPYPMQLYAPDGTLIAANAAFLAEFGIPLADLIVGKYNILRAKALEAFGVTDKIREVFAGRQDNMLDISAPVHLLKRGFRIPADGVELFRLDISGIPLKNESGGLVCVVLVFVTRKKTTDREEIVRAKEYMQQHWLERFNAARVACAALMSEAHFERMFRACTGMTPHDYYLCIKIDRLKKALLDPNLNVEQAFASCGLTYHSHYVRLFKKETGLTPTAYRRLAPERGARQA